MLRITLREGDTPKCDETHNLAALNHILPPPGLRCVDLGALAAGRILATEPVRLPHVQIGPHNMAANPLRQLAHCKA